MPSTLTSTASEPLLDVRGLRTWIPTRRGEVRAVDGIDLKVHAGEVVGLVGESGCGKTLAAYSILGLLPPPARVVAGEIRFRGADLSRCGAEERRRLRGSAMSMVFQEPLSALNPVFPVGVQIADILRQHSGLSARAIRARVLELLAHVGIASPDLAARAYPFQLSGGMRQRVLIAMAISCRPQLLIADEPTTALDATVQAQILDLLRRLVDESGIAMILISHDLAVVAEMCRRVYVMYAGRIVEHAEVAAAFDRPRHPYTSALLRCMPGLKQDDSPLETIEGVVPALIAPEPGCRFRPRCRHAIGACAELDPDPAALGSGHTAACHRAGELRLPGAQAVTVAGA
ncbi:MAG: ABC transporter ATP-binding protein [Alphaproteobacteria bacterium]|nr:ABC transporter ATP-binding protein [Alphaproteobacteria bacterium]